MIGLSIPGVEVISVEDRDNWIGLRYVVACSHCRGRRMPHGVDGRPDADIAAGYYAVASYGGSLQIGAAFGLLAHVAFAHTTLPVEVVDLTKLPPLTDAPSAPFPIVRDRPPPGDTETLHPPTSFNPN